MEKALLVTVKLKSAKDNWPVEDMAEELEELVLACPADIKEHVTYLSEKPTPNFFIGAGKVEEISLLSQELGVDTVIFGCDLSGVQQRNLEDLIGKKTIDRTQLILHIFARHAKSPEAKLQVELAQLQYLMPRLIGKGLILSRTGGGIGTSGPGEQRLEVDRRRIRKHIDKLRNDLKDYAQHRLNIKKKRKENALPSVALVGYTNAGKSTLLNALTGAGQVVDDSLFTTLDTLSRGMSLPNGERVIISDTVGFLHNLPHHLIEAFKATLEEVVDADLLIHVLDISHPRVYERSQSVFAVLKELKAQDRTILTALNKIDLLDDLTWLERLKTDFPGSIPISSSSGENLNILLANMQDKFSARMTRLQVLIPLKRMDLVDLFYRQAKVEEIRYLQEGIKIKLTLPKILSHKLLNDQDIKKLD